VVTPDPITPHGQSSRGAAEGEGHFPTAMMKLDFKIEAFIFVLILFFNYQ
jgi:hypothetical protein